MKHKQTKATDISPKVKLEVWERDNQRCVVCGTTQAMPNAHVFVSRAKGGLGVKENVVTLCQECHRKLDNGKNKEHYSVKSTVFNYMFKLYPNLNKEELKVK